MTRLERIQAIRKLGRRIAGTQAAARIKELRDECDGFLKAEEEASRREQKGSDRMKRSGLDRAAVA